MYFRVFKTLQPNTHRYCVKKLLNRNQPFLLPWQTNTLKALSHTCTGPSLAFQHCQPSSHLDLRTALTFSAYVHIGSHGLLKYINQHANTLRVQGSVVRTKVMASKWLTCYGDLANLFRPVKLAMSIPHTH